eukprot:768677-Hanusia_phi.AAC.6
MGKVLRVVLPSAYIGEAAGESNIQQLGMKRWSMIFALIVLLKPSRRHTNQQQQPYSLHGEFGYLSETWMRAICIRALSKFEKVRSDRHHPHLPPPHPHPHRHQPLPLLLPLLTSLQPSIPSGSQPALNNKT